MATGGSNSTVTIYEATSGTVAYHLTGTWAGCGASSIRQMAPNCYRVHPIGEKCNRLIRR